MPVSRLATVALTAAALVVVAGLAALFVNYAGPRSPEGAGVFTIAAEDISYDKETLEFPNHSKIRLAFENREGVPHNVSIYEKKDGQVIFAGEVLNEEGEKTYEFMTAVSGSYYFQCDVHPGQMNGEVIVASEASEE